MMETDDSREEKSSLKQIRTFQGDVADALSRQNESLVSIQRQEFKRARALGNSPAEMAAEKNFKKKREDFVFLLIGSVFLLAVGSVGAWFGYREFRERMTPSVISTPSSRFITPESGIKIDLSLLNRESFASAFADQTQGLKPLEMRHVDTNISTEKFFELLESRASGTLKRSFGQDFMLGAVGEHPFIIIKLVSFENAYPGMLAWEPDMPADLSPVFPKAYTDSNVFKDIIIKNKDVRALYIGEKPALLYTFLDNNMLIITESFESLQTLIDRLTREKLSR